MGLHGLGHGSNMSLDWIISAALSRGGLDKFLDNLLYSYREQQ